MIHVLEQDASVQYWYILCLPWYLILHNFAFSKLIPISKIKYTMSYLTILEWSMMEAVTPTSDFRQYSMLCDTVHACDNYPPIHVGMARHQKVTFNLTTSTIPPYSGKFSRGPIFMESVYLRELDLWNKHSVQWAWSRTSAIIKLWKLWRLPWPSVKIGSHEKFPLYGIIIYPVSFVFGIQWEHQWSCADTIHSRCTMLSVPPGTWLLCGKPLQW
jgi:hypothetical protein